MSYFKSKILSNLTGFVIAAIFLMVPLSEAEMVFGQNLDSQATQGRTGYFLQTGIDILTSANSGSSTTARIFIINGHRFTA